MDKISEDKKKRKEYKNPNGYGSIIKMPGRRRKPYAVRVTVGWEEAVATRGERKGELIPRQKFQYIGFYEEKKDAILALTQHHVSPVSPRASITLEELYLEWSEQKFPRITKATVDNYKAAWKHLSPDAGVKVKDYRTAHVQRRIDDCHKAGMSHSSLQKIRTLAVILLDHAMKNDLVNKNYAKLVEMPKVEKIKKGRFSDLEIKKLWKHVDVPWVDTVLILIYTGMRITELLTLTKFSIDWDRQIIIGGIKTEAGKDRIIPIHPRILPLIKKWYDKGGETLICDEGGKTIKQRRYRETMYMSALERVGVSQLNPHSCRHTFASMMADAGVDPKAIQEIIGHANYSTTADIYTHKDLEKLAQAMERI